MKKLVAVLLLMLILTGCSGSDEPVSLSDTLTEIVNPDTYVTVTETPVITDMPIETTPEITAVPELTATPIPTETPTPVPGQKFGFEVYNAKYDNGQGYVFDQEYWLMDTWIDSRDSESVKEACEKIHIDDSRLNELLSQYPSEYRKDGHYMYVFGYISSENITEGLSLSEDNAQECGCRMGSSLVQIGQKYSLDMFMVGFFFDNETLKQNATPIIYGSPFVVFADNTYTDTLSWSQSKDKIDIPIVFVAYSEDAPDYPQGNPWYKGIVISVYDKTAVEYISHKPMIPEMGKNRYKVKDESKSYDFSDVSVGDTITFGAYEQDNNFENGSEPVEWIVIGKEDDKLLVLSKNILDNSCFTYMGNGYTWEKCYLRSWLNSMFYDCCFSQKEKDMIKETSLTDKSGNVTTDKVFLLSKEEAESLDDRILEAVPSEYASSLWMQSRLWVLRTSDQDGAACSVFYLSYDESVYFNYYTVSYLNIFGVRPAMYIKINDKK